MTAVAALDWALHEKLIDESNLDQLGRSLPGHKRYLLQLVDPLCESRPESEARTRLTLAGHRVRSQVPLGRQRIDLEVDGVLALEVDGERWHFTTFEEDRRKDLAMTCAGYHALRASARMVLREWPQVQAAVDAALRGRRRVGNSGRGRPRRPPRARNGPDLLSFRPPQRE